MTDAGIVDENAIVITECLDDLAFGLRDALCKMKTSFDQLLGVIESKKESIHLRLDFIQDQIELRIESLKVELENVHEMLKNEIQHYRNHVLKKTYEEPILAKTNQFKEEVDRLEREVKTRESITACFNSHSSESMDKQRSILQELDAFVKAIQSENFTIKFKPSQASNQSRLVGSMILQNRFSTGEVRDVLNNYQTWRQIELTIEPNDVCVLPNGYVLITCGTQRSLNVFNHELELVQTVTEFDGQPFLASRVTCNQSDRIYATDATNNQIVSLDFDFKLVKRVSDASQFDLPNGIQAFMGRVYVCDSENSRLQVLTGDLDFERPVQLGYKPWEIKISQENVACISRFDKAGVFFYDLDSFSLKISYNNHGYGRISEIESYFYEACHSGAKVYCYDKNGSLLERVHARKLGKFLAAAVDGSLAILKNTLIMTSFKQKCLLKLIKS